MKNILEQFWSWCKLSPHEYADVGMNQNKGEFEDDFPLFDEIISSSKEIIDSNILDLSTLNNLLSMMALDNESETILNYIEEHSSNEQLNKIIELGIYHLQPHARWQIAELLYRRKPSDFILCLNVLSNDNHEYVKRRAKNCLEFLE